MAYPSSFTGSVGGWPLVRIMSLIDDSGEFNFLDNRWLWPRKAGAAICARLHARVHVPRRTDKHTPPISRWLPPGEAGPSLGSGSHIEAQIGTQSSALGSHCRIPGVC